MPVCPAPPPCWLVAAARGLCSEEDGPGPGSGSGQSVRLGRENRGTASASPWRRGTEDGSDSASSPGWGSGDRTPGSLALPIWGPAPAALPPRLPRTAVCSSHSARAGEPPQTASTHRGHRDPARGGWHRPASGHTGPVRLCSPSSLVGAPAGPGNGLQPRPSCPSAPRHPSCDICRCTCKPNPRLRPSPAPPSCQVGSPSPPRCLLSPATGQLPLGHAGSRVGAVGNARAGAGHPVWASGAMGLLAAVPPLLRTGPARPQA